MRQWASPFDPAFDPQTDLDGSVSRHTNFGYDYLNRQTSRTLPDSQSEYTSYDDYGRIQERIKGVRSYFYNIWLYHPWVYKPNRQPTGRSDIAIFIGFDGGDVAGLFVTA